MSKQVTVTFEVTYDLKEGQTAEEYREQLHGYRDRKSQREWFVIDRFVGHENLHKFDRGATLTIKETN